MKQQKILVIGAGLSGTLLAICLARRGLIVELHEKLPDLRTHKLSGGRSINLALSNRGLLALAKFGVTASVMDLCLPMLGRMIHNPDGSTRFSKYSGRVEDCIYSVSRSGLNELLLDEASKYSNLSITFNSKCTKVELSIPQAHFINTDGHDITVKADYIFGADGAGSAVRSSMLKNTAELVFNYSQSFLPTGYKELSIPPNTDGTHKIENNALHIWPRAKFMLIALPNLDGSFTATMFNPLNGENGFINLDSKSKIISFFQLHYSDVIEHIPNLASNYFNNPVGILGTVKCSPWHAYNKTMLLGDAAHAIVPFYGQGMNASFEDVRIMDELVEKLNGDWNHIFQEFESQRKINTDAIADLAIDNFYEMQDKVDDVLFIKKRNIEMKLEAECSQYYSKYSMVTFRPELPYSQAMNLGRRQDAVLLDMCENEHLDDMPTNEIYSLLLEKMKS